MPALSGVEALIPLITPRQFVQLSIFFTSDKEVNLEILTDGAPSLILSTTTYAKEEDHAQEIYFVSVALPCLCHNCRSRRRKTDPRLASSGAANHPRHDQGRARPPVRSRFREKLPRL